MARRSRDADAFTLIEWLVVVGVVGIMTLVTTSPAGRGTT